jgi:hypothetical protein
MNRHESRKRKAQWRRDVTALHKEAGGVMQNELITPTDVLFRPDGEKIFAAICQWLGAIPEDGFLCFACEHTWHKDDKQKPVAFVLTQPWERPDASRCMLSGVCEACFATVAKNFGAVCTESLSKIWPDLRLFDAVQRAPGGLQ